VTPKRSLALTALAVSAGLIAIFVLPPEIADAALVVSLPPLVILALLSEGYIVRIYHAQPVPRSRFFRMLVAAQSGKLALGVWIAYLVVVRAGDRTGWFSLPSPTTAISGPISGLLVAVVVAIPISYAWEIWRVRRTASRADTTKMEDEVDLDREPTPNASQ
jgi:hypothetical protein